MELFNKYDNLYFAVGKKIIEASNNDNIISERELSKIVGKYGILNDNYDFINALVGKSNASNKFHGICILEPAGEKIFRSIIAKLPLVLSNVEKEALKDSLSSDIASAFVREEILAKFGIISKSSLLSETLGKVVTAIKTDKWIVFDNNAADGKLYTGQHVKPQKIEHSLASGEFFVSGYSKEAARLIKCNLKRITIHSIENGEVVDLDSALIQKRCREPIRISIENQKNAIDRAFNMFSCYEKDGYYNKKADRYILDIYYYEFEERILVNKILSLGSVAVVVSPSGIKDKITDRIKKQLLKLT